MTDEHDGTSSGRRVHWLELFFDLVMVAYIGAVAHEMHGDPDWLDALGFFVLLAAAWWAWVNATLTMNLFGTRVTPSVWIAATAAMAAIGLMAASVPEAFGDRAAAFAVGNAVIRLVWMMPWLIHRRESGYPWWRPIAYNVVPAALWLGSIPLESPWRYVLWCAAVAVEVVLLAGIDDGSSWLRQHLDLDHVLERVGLLIVIVFGESVLSLISAVTDNWNAAALTTTGLGFVAVVLLAWTYFEPATHAVGRGLRRLQRSGSVAGLRDAVMYLPYLLVAGIALFAAGLATAVTEATAALPLAAAVCLGGGVSLFYLASTVEALRYGAGWRDVAMWGPAGIVLPWTVVPIALVLAPAGVVAGIAIVIAILVALIVINGRRMEASPAI